MLLQLFKGLSDPVRLRIAHLLAHSGELCVCHITDALSLPQSTVSRHLNTLKHCGLVVAERRGKWVYYCLMDSDDVTTIAKLIKSSPISDGQFEKDISELKKSTC
ncbi:MAG: metalloregulator ArsR/SmtB family transcription factor [Mariprofundaceae bacterium]|nr:metalloregulator ArsR/SmtB family transcription factor [Mariprofundaceae bacterium]